MERIWPPAFRRMAADGSLLARGLKADIMVVVVFFASLLSCGGREKTKNEGER